jgi:hypothetical protein
MGHSDQTEPVPSKQGQHDTKLESFHEEDDIISELRAIGSEYVPAPSKPQSPPPPPRPGSGNKAESVLRKLYQAKQPEIRLTSPVVQNKSASFESHTSKDSKADSLTALSNQVSKATKAIISTASTVLHFCCLCPCPRVKSVCVAFDTVLFFRISNHDKWARKFVI